MIGPDWRSCCPALCRATGRYFSYKNLQGDVLGLYNSAGKVVFRYEYDSWGKVISVKDVDGNEITNPNSLGHINPIRYRGYYYDTESGLYYLQTRYYDPENGRFINADTIAGNTGNSTYNLFVYCANDPVNNVYPTGMCSYYSVGVRDPCTLNRNKNSNSVPIVQADKSQNQRPNDKFNQYDDDELIEMRKRAKGKEKKELETEEKVRGLRDKQKRQSPKIEPLAPGAVSANSSAADWSWAEPVAGAALAAVGIVLIVVLIADDATGVGVADDVFLVPAAGMLCKGVEAMGW